MTCILKGLSTQKFSTKKLANKYIVIKENNHMMDDWKLLELATRKSSSKPLWCSYILSLMEQKTLQVGGNKTFTDDSKSAPVWIKVRFSHTVEIHPCSLAAFFKNHKSYSYLPVSDITKQLPGFCGYLETRKVARSYLPPFSILQSTDLRGTLIWGVCMFFYCSCCEKNSQRL